MIETINSTITGTPFVQGSVNVIESLTFSEPLKLYDYVRYAYITFTSEEVFQKALELLNGVYIKDYMLVPSTCNTPYKQSKLTPPLPEHQIKLDLFNCKRLIKEVFDIEKNVSNNIVAHAEKAGGSVESQLDYLILYLRRVHGYCFYSGERCSDERSLTTKSAPLYLR
jgi:RNA recognition motif-containing protein